MNYEFRIKDFFNSIPQSRITSNEYLRPIATVSAARMRVLNTSWQDYKGKFYWNMKRPDIRETLPLLRFANWFFSLELLYSMESKCCFAVYSPYVALDT